MKQYEEVVVQGEKFTLQHPLTTPALELLERLLAVSGGALGEAVGGVTGQVETAIPKMVGALTASMGKGETSRLIRDLVLAYVVIGSKAMDKATFEVTFQGKTGMLAKLTGEIVKFGYSDFYDTLAEAFRSLVARGSRSQGIIGSVGRSGGSG